MHDHQKAERWQAEKSSEARSAACRAYATLVARFKTTADLDRYVVQPLAHEQAVLVTDRNYKTDYLFSADGSAHAYHAGTRDEKSIAPTAMEIEAIVGEVEELAKSGKREA